jgi:hypothetical protein
MFPKLQALVTSGQIKSYNIQDVDENGVIGSTSDFRNSQLLTIHFNNGLQIEISAICSGSKENTTLTVE